MGDWSDVSDAKHVEAGSLQGTDSSLAAAAGAFDEDLDLAEAVFHRATGGAFRSQLGGKWRALTRALEVGRAGASPAPVSYTHLTLPTKA